VGFCISFVISKIWQIFHPKKEDNVIKFAPQKEIPFLSKKTSRICPKQTLGFLRDPLENQWSRDPLQD
jgi:hypothetical protein